MDRSILDSKSAVLRVGFGLAVPISLVCTDALTEGTAGDATVCDAVAVTDFFLIGNLEWSIGCANPITAMTPSTAKQAWNETMARPRLAVELNVLYIQYHMPDVALTPGGSVDRTSGVSVTKIVPLIQSNVPMKVSTVTILNAVLLSSASTYSFNTSARPKKTTERGMKGTAIG